MTRRSHTSFLLTIHAGVLLILYFVPGCTGVKQSIQPQALEENYHDLMYEFVFAIPTLAITGNPARVSITTHSPTPVEAKILIHNTDFEISTTVTGHADVNIPSKYRMNFGNNEQTNTTIVVQASEAVSVHALDNEYSAGDGFLAIASSALNTQYYVASYPPDNADYPSCLICLSAIQNETLINITTRAGDMFLVNLDQYESYRFDGSDYEDLSGTFIKSNKPIAVISGVFTNVPSGVCCLDGVLEQLSPTNTWGFRYILAPHKDKPSGYIFRVFTGDYTSTLSWNNRNKTVSIIPPRDFYEEDIPRDTIVSFTSDHPVQVAQYMKGYFADNPSRGDPSMLVVPPMSAFTSNITFPVIPYNLTTSLQLYYVNVIVSCSDIDGLVFDDTIPMRDWERLSVMDESMCVVRSNVSVGIHSVSHPDASATFAVSVYNMCDGCGSSYAYPAATSLPMCSGKTCHDYAYCDFVDDDFYCICESGYQGDGIICEVISEKKRLDTTIIIAISSPLVAMGVMVVIMVVVVWSRRKQKSTPDDTSLADGAVNGAVNEGANLGNGNMQYTARKEPAACIAGTTGLPGTSDNDTGDYEIPPYSTIQGYFSQISEEESWEINWDNLMLGKTILGEGSFGQVREGVVWIGDKGVKVAVKALKEGASVMEKRDFIKEFDTMIKIGRHPNIVALVGACDHGGTFHVALELIQNGNLRSLLRKRRDRDKNAVRILTLEKMMEIARDVANGMEHLADIGIIHRDLAARNVLLDEDYIAKVSDFGLSREEAIYQQRTKQRVPIRWMAPESIAYSTYTTGSDVWSFGVLLWEIGSLGGTPYSNIASRNLLPHLNNGYRMSKPDKCSDDVYEMMQMCWSHEPENRPSFSELHHTLDQMNQTYMEVYETANLTPIDPDRDDM